MPNPILLLERAGPGKAPPTERLWCRSHDEAARISDGLKPTANGGAEHVLSANPIYIARDEGHWAQLLLLTAAGHAEVWRLYRSSFANYARPMWMPERLEPDTVPIPEDEFDQAVLERRQAD